MGDGTWGGPVDCASRRPDPHGPGGPCRDKRRWGQSMRAVHGDRHRLGPLSSMLQSVFVLKDLLPGQGEQRDIQVRLAFRCEARQLHEFVPVFLDDAPIQAWHTALEASNLLPGTENRTAPTP